MHDRTQVLSFFPTLDDERRRSDDGSNLAPVLDRRGRIPDAVDARLAELARRARRGDFAARNALFLALRPRLDPVLRGIRGNGAWRAHEGRAWTFDDVEQEAFLIFLDVVEAWNGAEPRFAGYFFTRFRWRMLDLLRKWSAPLRVELPLIAGVEVPFDETDAIEARLSIASLFSALNDRDRRLLEWRVVDGRTDAEIAALQGIGLITARRRRRAAFARARTALDAGAASD